MLYELEDVEVKWICDSDEDRLRRFADRYPRVSATSEISTCSDDDEVDCVAIATPVHATTDWHRRACKPASTLLWRSRWPARREAAETLVELADELRSS